MRHTIDGHFDRLEHIIQGSPSRAASEREVLAEIMRSHGALFAAQALDPDALYRALACRHTGPLAALLAAHFTVLARPGEAPVASPQAGDVLVRVGLPGLGHVAVLAEATLWPAAQLANAPFRSESQQRGFYALVIEAGAFPHTCEDPFARCILDAAGRMLSNQLLLRPTLFMDGENSIETLSTTADCEVLDEDSNAPFFPMNFAAENDSVGISLNASTEANWDIEEGVEELAEATCGDDAAYAEDEALFELEGPKPVSRPAPNAVDAEAAEPIFSGHGRAPEAPLLDVATLKRSSRWNQATHPKLSGITLAELRVRLERYLDRAALDNLVRRANASAASPYEADDATLVTLLAHQFQRKTCRTPTVGDITTPCTVDGRVAEDTLDALGFVYHAGGTINAADQANRVAAATLSRLPASAFTGVEPGLTARTWWSYMVSPPWLGLPIKHGIHLVLLKRLRRAQRALMSLPAYADLSPAALGQALGLEEEHKGARPGNTDWSMHLFGLAIDIGYTRNPWVSNPKRNTTRLAEVTLRAARLVGTSGASGAGITARFLHGLAITHRDTAKIYRMLADRSQWLGEYFALAGNAKRLEGLLPTANVMYPDGGWFRRSESLAEAAQRWTRVIRADFADFAVAVSRGGNKNDVRHGFMDLARDLVIALRDEACLGWGAVDFGPRVSGDIMHFDCRVEGIGRAIATTAEEPFVPDAGHPCLPAGRGQSVQPELEWEAPPKRPPAPPPPPPTPGRWLPPFTSSALPQYKDAAGTSQSTACSVYVPDVAWKEKTIDLLVFFHGDPGPCSSTFDPDPKNSRTKFGLDAQIHGSGRKVALAVPVLFWIPGNKNDDANIKGIWTAANFNKFVDEVLAAIGKESRLMPKLGRLILAGHSHAYGILTPLAREFNQGVPATKTGALANLDEVWALDSTYGARSVRALEAWSYTLPNRRFIAVLNKTPASKGEKPKPIDGWNGYYRDYSFGFRPPPNLWMCTVDETHCVIPTKYIGNLLSTTRSSQDWCRP